MTKHWVLHLDPDPVSVYEVPELFVMFYHLVGTENNIFVDLAMFFHYIRVIGIASLYVAEEHGDCFQVQALGYVA